MDYETGRSQRALMDALYEKPAQYDVAADRETWRNQAEKVATQRALLFLLRQNPELLTQGLLNALSEGYCDVAQDNSQYFTSSDPTDYQRRFLAALKR
jgi:hypothetical protein